MIFICKLKTAIYSQFILFDQKRGHQISKTWQSLVSHANWIYLSQIGIDYF